MIDITVNALEKFTWASPDIAHFMKVICLRFFILVDNLNIKFLQIELDEKFGCSWHVVVGEDFGFDMTFEVLHIPHFP